MLRYCTACTTAYAHSLTRCPHCGGTDYLEEPVPKIHADGSVSDELDPERAALINAERGLTSDEPRQAEAAAGPDTDDEPERVTSARTRIRTGKTRPKA